MTEATETDRRPRLSILHLMGAMTCIAVYLAITRAFGSVLQPRQFVGHHFFWAFNGIGSGVALGGLLLLVSMRIQGLPFPRYPGEWLWIVAGVSIAASLSNVITHVSARLAIQRGILESGDAGSWVSISAPRERRGVSAVSRSR